MRAKMKMLAACGMALALGLAAAQNAEASEWNQKTILTVDETIEVPGALLDPGTYVMKLVDSDANRHIVQFTNEREDQVLSTVIAIPNKRLEPTGDTEFAWYETPAGQPPAMRAWFFPGELSGQEFVYDERRGSQLAASARRSVPTTAETLGADDDTLVYRETEIYAMTPERERTDVETAAASNEAADRDRPTTREGAVRTESPDVPTQAASNEPVQLAQSNDPVPTPRMEESEELPETAGPAPLLALLGLISLGSGLAVRKLRK